MFKVQLDLLFVKLASYIGSVSGLVIYIISPYLDRDVIFLRRCFLSIGADGLVKLWTIKTNECVNTFDYHEDKVVYYLPHCFMFR